MKLKEFLSESETIREPKIKRIAHQISDIIISETGEAPDEEKVLKFIYKMLKKGKTSKEIIDYANENLGEFKAFDREEKDVHRRMTRKRYEKYRKRYGVEKEE